VNDNICAVVQRILHIGAEECIVDDHHDAMLMGFGRNSAYVHQTKGGIAGALDPYQFGLARPNQLGHVKFNAWREGDLNAVCCCNFGEISMCATIDVGDRDDMGTLCERLEYGGGGRGARGESKGVFGVFERSYGLFEVIARYNIHALVFVQFGELLGLPVWV